MANTHPMYENQQTLPKILHPYLFKQTLLKHLTVNPDTSLGGNTDFGGRWPLPLHQHSLTAPQQLKPQYLQRAVFPPLQELHEAIHHPGSGYDLVNGWVGFCPEQ